MITLRLVSTFLFLLITLSSGLQAQTTCNIIYVSTTGSPTAPGTMAQPTTLAGAFAISQPGDVLRLATGFYEADNAFYLKDSMTIEGGFIEAQNWTKTSAIGATYIRRFNVQAEGPAGQTRHVLFYGDSIRGFRLQDFRIAMFGGNAPGQSKYAIHLNNCSDYQIVRCWIASGPAAAGTDGTNGINGTNGTDGTDGQVGAENIATGGGGGGTGGNGGGGAVGGTGGLCCSLIGATGINGIAPAGINGGSGAGGGAGSGGANDGAAGGIGGGGALAGAGGLESGCNGGTITCLSPESGANGDDGLDGANGSDGVDGSGPQLVGGFWIPGTPGTDGTDGTGGEGGAGGGGGAGEGGAACVDGHGSGGGGGGGGGQAGTGGTGGTGGGNSIAIMLVNNGPNGVIKQCFIQSGNPGQGGAGGTGGTGGSGGQGGSGGNLAGDVGCGGDGGDGGSGGNGGNGGNGQDGVSYKIYLAGGAPLVQSDTTFDLLSQPVITVDGSGCIGATMTFADSALPIGVPGAGVGVTNWDFDRYSNFATPATGINNPDTTSYSQGGRYSFSAGIHVYEDFVLIQDTFVLPNAGVDVVLCDSTGYQLNGNTPNPGAKGVWSSLGTATVDEPSNPDTRVSGLVPGSNLFVWTIGNCCDEASDTVEVFINQMTSSVDVVVACDSFQWIDSVWYFTNNTTATDTFTNSVGCDSVVYLDLTVNYTSYFTDIVVSCDSFQWMNGEWYFTNNNTVSDTLINAAGCDSVIFLDLTVNYTTYGIDNVVACDSFQWMDGVTYYADNFTAMDTIPNTLGCDSVITLALTMNYTTYGTDVVHACDSYTWIDGITYTASNNTAIDTITNVDGCDSVVTLNLTVDYTTFGTDVVVACDAYTWMDGNTYTTSNNTAQHILTNAAGCDSVVTLDLTINYSETIIDQVDVCDTYTWPVNGETYTSNKNRTLTFTNAAGCDSIRILELTVRYSTKSTDTIRACDQHTWIDGMTYTSNNTTATDTSLNTVGCQHVTTLRLTIDTANPNFYFDALDSVFIARDTAPGIAYQWIQCEPTYKRLVNFQERVFEPFREGSFGLEVTRGSCVKTAPCVPFEYKGVGITERAADSMFNLYPNPNDGTFQVELNQATNVNLRVYSNTGQLVSSETNLSGLKTIDLNVQPGVYLIEFEHEGSKSFQQLIVH